MELPAATSLAVPFLATIVVLAHEGGRCWATSACCRASSRRTARWRPSAEAARLVLKTHDAALADRPPGTAAGAILSYGCRGILLSPRGAHWRMARRLCATQLFSARRVDQFERAREEETRALVRGVFERCGAAVEVREHLERCAMWNILRMAVGERWPGLYDSKEGEAVYKTSLDVVFAMTGAMDTDSNVGAWVPWMGRLDVQGLIGRMKRVHERLDRFYEQILVEHEEERRRRAGGGDGDGDIAGKGTLVDVLLQLLAEEEEEDEESETRLTRDGVKGMIQDIVTGGTDTTAATMEWALASCSPASWPDLPCAFRPERFLPGGGAAHGVDVRGKHFELLPFGTGRRMCPGYGLAMKEMAGTLANLLLGFAWRLPDGTAPEDLSMEEFFGMSVRRAAPSQSPGCRRTSTPLRRSRG
ncbi:hypothetical protein EJB05_00951, partial [Eragrostis curvula]